MIGCSCFAYDKLTTNLLDWSNPNQWISRSNKHRYFPIQKNVSILWYEYANIVLVFWGLFSSQNSRYYFLIITRIVTLFASKLLSLQECKKLQLLQFVLNSLVVTFIKAAKVSWRPMERRKINRKRFKLNYIGRKRGGRIELEL